MRKKDFVEALIDLKERLRNKWHTFLSWIDNIKRIVDFIPVLWRDWDFDARPGLYGVMKKKLERLEPCLRDGHLMNGERYARQIRVAVAVLNRLIEDRYEEEEFKPHDEKWGESEYLWMPTDETESAVELEIRRENARTLEEQKQEKDEFRAVMNRANARRERDLDWVFKHIRRWHQHWWD